MGTDPISKPRACDNIDQFLARPVTGRSSIFIDHTRFGITGSTISCIACATTPAIAVEIIERIVPDVMGDHQGVRLVALPHQHFPLR